MSNDQNHRKNERRPTTLPAAFRTAAGMRDEDGIVANLSTEGCCITSHTLQLSVGMRVMIKPQGMEAVSGVVRWIEKSRAGVQFDQPLYTAVAEHLAATNRFKARANF